ncbi:hypothetical protein [Belnapia moabensis]|uniref:hypothetical protein n=1 Tax=Belnapia moabensis TaxID=365533 RepID=UPI0005BC643E|nr:hypothetical protein [Belnapia moabensis]
MQPKPSHATPTRFIGYVSGHRFGLTLVACALVLVVMLLVVYDSVGFTPIWASQKIAGAA